MPRISLICLLSLFIPIYSQAELTHVKADATPTPTTPTRQHTLQRPQLPPVIPSTQVPADSWALLSYNSGQMLASHDANEELPPASLTKLMTAYVVLQAIEQNRIHLDDVAEPTLKCS